MNINPEIIRALTPICLATAGLIIGIVALFAPGVSETVRVSGLGMGGGAISGAAGLSQPSKPKSTVSSDNVETVNIE